MTVGVGVQGLLFLTFDRNFKAGVPLGLAFLLFYGLLLALNSGSAMQRLAAIRVARQSAYSTTGRASPPLRLLIQRSIAVFSGLLLSAVEFTALVLGVVILVSSPPGLIFRGQDIMVGGAIGAVSLTALIAAPVAGASFTALIYRLGSGPKKSVSSRSEDSAVVMTGPLIGRVSPRIWGILVALGTFCGIAVGIYTRSVAVQIALTGAAAIVAGAFAYAQMRR
jgi:hypothetical protein